MLVNNYNPFNDPVFLIYLLMVLGFLIPIKLMLGMVSPYGNS